MLYHYVGPPELRNTLSPTRRLMRSVGDFASWMAQTHQRFDAAGEVTATFIVSPKEQLWIADRHSEHVACSAGGPVLAAGEMTFSVVDKKVEVVAVTNQSTGFCPQLQSWSRVARAVDKIGWPHPQDFTAKFDFRRCDECGTINLVKEGWFWCAACEAPLNRVWNLGRIGAG